MRDFRALRVWREAHALTLSVYQATSGFPSEERFGLVAQLRRAAVSVPANIAESCGRRARRDEAHLLQVAFASASELEAELLLARDLQFMTEEVHARLSAALVDVKRKLGRLVQSTYDQAPWPPDG